MRHADGNIDNLPHTIKDLHVGLPIGKSLPNEFRTEVACLSERVLSQTHDNKASFVVREEGSSLRILNHRYTGRHKSEEYGHRA